MSQATVSSVPSVLQSSAIADESYPSARMLYDFTPTSPFELAVTGKCPFPISPYLVFIKNVQQREPQSKSSKKMTGRGGSKLAMRRAGRDSCLRRISRSSRSPHLLSRRRRPRHQSRAVRSRNRLDRANTVRSPLRSYIRLSLWC